ncbi:MAG: hypothetical protein NTZ46_08620 [Verrucomicrobia bacterium]|nr:hypothetical protein [Verrucomicrobiota bacterium]
MRIFLPWSEPFLPAVANCLLDECTQNSPASFDADLGGQVIVLRGRNAGRRLLALLAAEAQRRGRALIPPRMVTPGSLDSVLAGNKEKVAGRLLQRLAWAQVVTQSDQATLHSVWAAPAGQERTTALGRFLDQVWRELSTSGNDFSEAYRHLCQIAPEASVHEESRWTALDHLCGAYRQCLKKWGKIDPADSRREQSSRTAAESDVQVVLVGVVELAPALVALLKELPSQPRIFIHAPASEASGFDAWGRLVPGYWERRPCHFENGEIHVASDATDQAGRCAELIQCWNQSGLPCAAITLAIPESGSLSLIEHHLRDHSIPVRLAEGRPVAHSMVFQLLALWAECLDLGPESRMRYAALASLIRHPDVEKGLGYSAKKLDAYYNAHLPERLDLRVDGDDRWIADLLARVGELIRMEQESFAEDVTRLLLKVYGERRLNRHGPEDRATIYALEAIRGTLEEWKSLPREALRNCSPADLLRVIIETAGSTGIPSPEFPDAVELAGWLEAAADDSHALIVTSVFEGSLPEGTSAEPLLHDALRERLGLPCRSTRFARDQYTLWTVTESRRANGRVALIAPRRNATGRGIGHPVDRALLLAEKKSEPHPRRQRFSGPGTRSRTDAPVPDFSAHLFSHLPGIAPAFLLQIYFGIGRCKR